MNNTPKLLACEEATWLAAMMDAEGCFSVGRGGCSRTPTIVFIIGMYNNPIILKCREITGCGTIRSYVRRGNRMWYWQIAPKYGKPIITQVIPHLIEKKEQAEIFIRWPVWGTGSHGIPEYILKEREDLVSRIKYLNHSEHQHQPNYEYAPNKYCTMQATL